MSSISKEQALAIAKSFQDASVAVSNYRHANYEELAAQEREDLYNGIFTLHNRATEFITLSAEIALEDAGGSLKQLLTAVGDAKGMIENIETTKKLIELIGVLVNLGAAISTGDAPAIVAGVANLAGVAKEIREIGKPPKPE